MGWQRGGNVHINAANPPKAGHTMLAVWDPGAGDDLGVGWDRHDGSKKAAPNSTLKKGDTAQVVVT